MRHKKRILLLPLLLSLLLGCSRQTLPVEVPEPDQTGGQLMCEAETEEEARELAQLYGIVLVRFHNGLAVFYTEEDPAAVIERGRVQGWPELVKDDLLTIS